jgi:hypothetical protein
MDIPTKTLPNGLRVATDLAPFAPFVKGTVTSAIQRDDHWTVHYVTSNGRQRRTKTVRLSQ